MGPAKDKSKPQPPVASSHNGTFQLMWGVLLRSAQILPINKLAIGVVGIAAAVGIVSTFTHDRKTGVFGVLLAISFMALLLILGWAKQKGEQDARPFVVVFLMVVLLAFSITIGILVSTFGWGCPRHAAILLYGEQSEEVRHANVPTAEDIARIRFEFDDIVMQTTSQDYNEWNGKFASEEAIDWIRGVLKRMGVQTRETSDVTSLLRVEVERACQDKNAMIAVMQAMGLK